ncbi:MAG: energy-coupling factor ABC transporter permease [Nitrospinota bacterium]
MSDRRLRKFFLGLGVFLGAGLFPLPAFAMHITEGILPAPWAALWAAVVAPFVVLGLLRVREKKAENPGYMPLLGIAGAAVFVFSTFPIPVPIAGTSSHPAGTGLSTVLLGPFPSILVAGAALLIQALFLAHGGLTTLGANLLSMGVVGSLAAWAAFRGARRAGTSLFWACFLAGLSADFFTYLTTSIELGLALHGDAPALRVIGEIFIAFMPTQIPLAFLEGALTGGIVVHIHKHRPGLLRALGVVAAR